MTTKTHSAREWRRIAATLAQYGGEHGQRIADRIHRITGDMNGIESVIIDVDELNTAPESMYTFSQSSVISRDGADYTACAVRDPFGTLVTGWVMIESAYADKIADSWTFGPGATDRATALARFDADVHGAKRLGKVFPNT